MSVDELGRISLGVLIPMVPTGVEVDRSIRVFRDNLSSRDRKRNRLVRFSGDLEPPS